MKKSYENIINAISLISIIAMFFIEPIRQNQEYHNFADYKTIVGIPNFWNVFSNLPFIIIGVLGFIYTFNLPKSNNLKNNYLWFFIGIFLTGFGSAYYHYCPNDSTLIWDRLPMTISFMSFFTIIIFQFVDGNYSKKLLNPLLIIGIMSIGFWLIYDDLRFYVLVQFLPIILLLFILIFTRKNINSKKIFWQILLCYIIAKLFESFDLQIYNYTFELISGHSLKHFVAAVAPFLFLNYIKKRTIANV